MEQSELNSVTFSHQLLELVGNSCFDRLLVGLSGGPDSVALLSLACACRKALGIEVIAAHVNYQLRGKESDEDQQFCIELCRKLKVRLYRRKVKVTKQRETNLQACAREIRYSFFWQLCDKHRINFIATGHNQSDNAETFLLNLFRGAGTFGLGGIRERSGRIIRPLLRFSSKQILLYLREQKLSFREDSSNLKPDYRRNRLRLKLLPQIEDYFGESTGASIARAALILAEQRDYLIAQAEKLIKRDATIIRPGKIELDLSKFSKYNKVLGQIVIAICLEKVGAKQRHFDFAVCRQVFNLIGASEGRCNLKAGVFAEIANDKLYLYCQSKAVNPVELQIPGETYHPELGVIVRSEMCSAREISSRELKAGKNLKVYCDYSALSEGLVIRAWRKGDRLQPLGMKGSKKLSDFFIDKKIARPLRDEIPLLAVGSKVLWVVGQAIAEQARITDTTNRIARLEAVYSES